MSEIYNLHLNSGESCHQYEAAGKVHQAPNSCCRDWLGKVFFLDGYFFHLQILRKCAPHAGGKVARTQLSSVLVIPVWWETGWSTMLGCLTMWLPTRWWYTSTASEVDNSLKTGSPRKTASDRSALVDIQRVRHPVAKGGRWKTFGYSTTCTWAVSNSCCLVEQCL